MSKDVKENKAKDAEPQIRIDQMSLVELKSLAYDLIAVLEKNRADLRMINEQIAKKAKMNTKGL